MPLSALFIGSFTVEVDPDGPCRRGAAVSDAVRTSGVVRDRVTGLESVCDALDLDDEPSRQEKPDLTSVVVSWPVTARAHVFDVLVDDQLEPRVGFEDENLSASPMLAGHDRLIREAEHGVLFVQVSP